VTLSPADIESLERATVAAVAPPEVIEIDGWLAPFDDGTIGRAKSAAPLSHTPDAGALPRIIAAYEARGLPPAFRIPDAPALDSIRNDLSEKGFRPGQPTLVKVGDAMRMAAFAPAGAELLEAPDEGWGQVFVGDGFDPVDGAHRVKVLSRSPGALYGVVREGGPSMAVGVMSLGEGWAGVHGMRTAPQARGRGYASRILASFGQAALDRGLGRVFLQVEEPNPARRLYRRAGFERVWSYHYWTR
jgi:GNAT superfamily N-acetyltransferase